MGTGLFSGCSHKSNFVSLLAVHAPLKIEKLISDLLSFLRKIGLEKLFDVILAGSCQHIVKFSQHLLGGVVLARVSSRFSRSQSAIYKLLPQIAALQLLQYRLSDKSWQHLPVTKNFSSGLPQLGINPNERKSSGFQRCLPYIAIARKYASTDPFEQANTEKIGQP